MSTASQLTQVDILYPVLAGRFLSGRDVILVVDNVESQQLAWLNIDDSELMLVSGPLGKITLGANVRGRVLFSYSGSISGSGWGTVQLTQ